MKLVKNVLWSTVEIPSDEMINKYHLNTNDVWEDVHRPVNRMVWMNCVSQVREELDEIA